MPTERGYFSTEELSALAAPFVSQFRDKLQEKLGVSVNLTDEAYNAWGDSRTIRIVVEGLDTSISLHLTQQSRAYGWRHTPQPLFEIRTPSTDYGTRGYGGGYTNIPAQTFKQREKDKGFPVEKLADKVVLIYGYHKRQQDIKEAKAANGIALADYQRLVWGQQEIPKYDDLKVEVETNPEAPLKLSFSFTESCTPERAAEIRAGLVALGLISEK